MFLSCDSNCNQLEFIRFVTSCKTKQTDNEIISLPHNLVIYTAIACPSLDSNQNCFRSFGALRAKILIFHRRNDSTKLKV